MKYLFYLLLGSLLFTNCKSVRILPTEDFNESKAAAAPDYSKSFYWAALPNKADEADKTPKGVKDEQANAEVDVFFLHPTIYTGEEGDDQWNGPVNDPALNKRVDESTIRFQASIFNGNAFQYYLDNYNNGRPIIIASHSQGTTHSKRLVKEFFDGTELQKQFVAGYLVGIPVLKDEFDHIPVCQSPTETGCFTSWRTFRSGFIPEQYTSDKVAVTNPLTWTTDDTAVSKSQNKGAILRKFNKVHDELCSAKVVPESGILWTDRPKFFGSFLLKTPNYHIADFNFYYMNVRENAQERAAAYMAKQLAIHDIK